MSFETRNTIIVCVPLEKAGFKNAFSTRHSSNLAYGRGPDSEVEENRRKFFHALGEDHPRVYTQHQVHSDRITFLGRNEIPHFGVKPGEEPQGDSLVTPESVWLGIKTADCLPVLIGDPKTKLIAAVHAGWKGTLIRIVEKTVKMMARQGAEPKNLIAALGPAACGDCYEIGADVADKFRAEFGEGDYLKKFSHHTDDGQAGGKFKLDVGLANVRQLLDAGLHPANIHTSTHCTMHQNQHFFSHRKEGQSDSSTVGRQLAVITRH